MESRKKYKNSGLPRTSRVNDKILDYYRKYGKDRDLEKFMRLYSPAGSQKSFCSRSRSGSRNRGRKKKTAPSSCGSSSDGYNIELENSKKAQQFQSKSLPDMEASLEDDAIKQHAFPSNTKQDTNEDVVIVICSPSSNKEPQTPKKITELETKGTQTPDSIVKSHKRLEWDSLGDVGYNKKSMSTSNISILERSLLRDFFQERDTKKPDSMETNNNVSESDLKRLQEDLLRQESQLQAKTNESKCSTPPLACSTFAEPKPRNETGTRPKFISKSTSTSLQKKIEKYAQTTLTTNSKEVQVSIAPSVCSNAGSSATPSSFEYYSSRSSRSSMAAIAACENSAQPQHPFLAGITEMLSRRKALVERNDSNNIKQLNDCLRQTHSENKENDKEASILSSTSSVSSSPRLDLGIQLLCSLIDARSLNPKQKKQLVRDIAKRISRLSSGSDTAPTNNNDSITKQDGEPQSKKNNEPNVSKLVESLPDPRGSKNVPKNIEPTNETSFGSGGHVVNIEVYENPPAQAPAIQLQISTERSNLSGETEEPSTTSREESHLPKMTLQKNQSEENDNLKVGKENKISTRTNQTPNPQVSSKLLKATEASNASSTSTTTARTSCSSTSSSTKEIMTQKAAGTELHDTANNTDHEHMTMREWLNPLTQSEIDYETKKREKMKNGTGRTQLLYKTNVKKVKNGSEREYQLNWIEAEIFRLESLKHLLLKTVNNDEVPSTVYDTVFSDQSTETKSNDPFIGNTAESTEKPKTEVMSEKSSNGFVNLDENLKPSKDLQRETRILCAETGLDKFGSMPQVNVCIRQIREIITKNKEQQELPITVTTKVNQKQAIRQQRSKIDTPSGSNDSESVCSFVQQRKREFMEHYKNKKHNQIIRIRPATVANGTTQTINHYSMPHTMPRKHPINASAQHGHHHQHIDQNAAVIYRTAPPVPPQPPHALAKSQNDNYTVSTGLTTITTNTRNPNSSSSLFCLSSEVSIPMGSKDSSSTPTTTHQYDDVTAAGALIAVGIQTTSSLLRTHPIVGSQINQRTYRVTQKPIGTQSVCVQVKPKAIAYIINFNNKSSSELSSLTNIPIENPGISQTSIDEQQTPLLTLQEYLQRAKPKFCAQSKQRKAILNEIQVLRQQRYQEMRDIVENTSLRSLDFKLQALPPPPIQNLRVFATKEMKARTNRRCASLPEVLEKQQREREERRRRSNRLLRDVFNRRLQKRVRSGKISLNHSRTVI